MATINFKYKYPYAGYSSSKYGWEWAESRITLNGNYTYPAVFNTQIPKCSHFSFTINVENTGSGTVLGIPWEVYIYTTSWVCVETFTMPTTGEYTFDGDISNLNIKKFLMVPSSRQSSGRTWTQSYHVENCTITEVLEENALETGMFQYGIFANYYGLTQRLNEIFVNVNGTLSRPTKILVNIDDTLTEIQNVNSAYLNTTSESTKLYSFTPTSSGTYKIQQLKISGDHEIRIYDSNFNQLYDGYFYEKSFELTQGSLYYITVMHYCGETDVSESYLQIYKEG